MAFYFVLIGGPVLDGIPANIPRRKRRKTAALGSWEYLGGCPGLEAEVGSSEPLRKETRREKWARGGGPSRGRSKRGFLGFWKCFYFAIIITLEKYDRKHSIDRLAYENADGGVSK